VSVNIRNSVSELKIVGWDGVYWIDTAQDRDQWRALVNTVLNFRVPLNAGKFLRGCTIGGSSRMAQLCEEVLKLILSFIFGISFYFFIQRIYF
jgi:hypothetical protein